MRESIQSFVFFLGFTFFVVGVFLLWIGIGYYSTVACPYVPVNPCASGNIYWPDALPGILLIISGLGFMIGSRFPSRKLSQELALGLLNNLRSSLLCLGAIFFVAGVSLYLFGQSYTMILCPSGTDWCGGGGIYLYARVSGIALTVTGTAIMFGSRFVKDREVHITQSGSVNASARVMRAKSLTVPRESR